jgi:hypothetical protein
METLVDRRGQGGNMILDDCDELIQILMVQEILLVYLVLLSTGTACCQFERREIWDLSSHELNATVCPAMDRHILFETEEAPRIFRK